MTNQSDNDEDSILLSADKRFKEQAGAIRVSTLEKLDSFLQSQGDDVRESLLAGQTNADQNNDRVLKFARLVYVAAGQEVVAGLQRSYEDQLNDLMAEVDRLKRETISYSRGLKAGHEKRKLLTLITRMSDGALAALGAVTAIIIAVYGRTFITGIIALGAIAIVVAWRIWTELQNDMNQKQMENALDPSSLDRIHEEITQKRRKLGKTLIEYGGHHGEDTN